MHEIDWEQEKPTSKDIERMWQEISFENTKIDEEGVLKVERLLDEIAVNGGCFVKKFRISENQVFDWFASRNILQEMDFYENFLTSESLNAAVPELDTVFVRHLEIERFPSLTLDGYIAQMMISGGAYESFEGSYGEAKKLGQKFCSEIFGERYEEILVGRSLKKWGDWFVGITHWDETWYVLDRRKRTVWIIAFTDTD